MNTQKHEWWVIGPASSRAVVLVWCAKTGARGEILDASQAEYLDSRDAIDRSYRWNDDARVTVTATEAIAA